MEDNQLAVRMHGKPVGVLGQINGKLSFWYLSRNPEQISSSLPLSSVGSGIFLEHQCRPFFEGLLPDSEDARKAIAKKHGFSERNIFKLLEAIGTECAGAISFHPIDEPVNETQHDIIDASYKTDEEIERLILEKLPTNPLLNSIDDVRLSLAGVQNKLCVVIDHLNPKTTNIGLPHSGTISTHILKPEIPNFPNSAFNEYFCLTLAKVIGLKTAKVAFRKIGKTPCAIIERYDREWTHQNNQFSVRRLHQEDFCQALRKLPSQKYQNEGGPSLKDCFDLLGGTSPHFPHSIEDRLYLIDYVFFNFIVGNTDAHGKNFSILYGSHSLRSSLARLAPLYDVLCCQIYPEHSQRMAMKIGDQKFANDVYARHWRRLCESIHIAFPQFKERSKKICRDIKFQIDVIISGHEQSNEYKEYMPFAKEMRTIIVKNIDAYLTRIDENGSVDSEVTDQ